MINKAFFVNVLILLAPRLYTPVHWLVYPVNWLNKYLNRPYNPSTGMEYPPTGASFPFNWPYPSSHRLVYPVNWLNKPLNWPYNPSTGMLKLSIGMVDLPIGLFRSPIGIIRYLITCVRNRLLDYRHKTDLQGVHCLWFSSSPLRRGTSL